jgi:hypothetical protein
MSPGKGYGTANPGFAGANPGYSESPGLGGPETPMSQYGAPQQLREARHEMQT